MIDGHIKPKHDFHPATTDTAFNNARAIAVEVGFDLQKTGCGPATVRTLSRIAYQKAIDMDTHLQNFLSTRYNRDMT